jgi:2-polyprenyl-3-methyl-5-hydroxy-6-metoxy-1,4-benzoquinol methylase
MTNKLKGNHIWRDNEITGNINHTENLKSLNQKNTWHKLLKSPKWRLQNPAEELVEFYIKYIDSPSRQFRERCALKFKKIHDLGCGGGRHTAYFAELGFEVTGSDISTNAIKYTDIELRRRQLKARLITCPMTKLPFKDGEFDITISRAVIIHATLQDIKRTVYEVARTTKPGGLFFVTFVTERSSEWKVGKEILEDITYIPQAGPEKGLVHTYLTAANAVALLEPFFFIEEIYLSEHPAMIKAPDSTKGYFSSEYVVIGLRK